ncbi:MAG TPA: beta-ketoacyl synthase N-terminal-like domain-containing protein [Bacteroidales bacterium]|nr:beta-ketoacyl synthase N-terminal-like domain-containing protein [Bacteroidales bacterium]HRW94220.1 beta-ketoacyl synthase N-terminal-like domain-containing protein [Bacteroidales bacterium]
MIYKLSDNIISSLGFTTAANYKAVLEGKSGIAPGKDAAGNPIAISRIEPEIVEESFRNTFKTKEKYTIPEQAMLLSAHIAMKEAGIQAGSERTCFVLSSTKGNIHLLGLPTHGFGQDRVHLWHTAGLLAGFFGNPNTPFTVSNACISGACAQIAAIQLLEQGRYDHVVVTGMDLAPDFIVSGFQSFKSLDEERCRPFDARRKGLNLGEAAATIVYGKEKKKGISLIRGSIRNDANHISGPSRTGEGLYRALQTAMDGIPAHDIAFISAHGTATPYNDQMEAIAFSRAGLQSSPVFSLKALFGHTLGAAGILESIIAVKALEQGLVLPSTGYEEPGIEGDITISTALSKTDKRYCLKTLSGFGGCNAVLLFENTL